MRYLALTCVFVWGAIASATDLSGTLTADNDFSAYISTDDSQLGNLVSSGSAWGTPQSFDVSLTPGKTYYLHVVAFNEGGPDMFAGSFSLSDANFSFSNGTQSLDSDLGDWKGNLTGFRNAYTSPLNYGVNDNNGTWGTLGGINKTAHFIWMDDTNGTDVNNYFTTKITPNAVPEPATLTALGLGALALVRRRRNRSR